MDFNDQKFIHQMRRRYSKRTISKWTKDQSKIFLTLGAGVLNPKSGLMNLMGMIYKNFVLKSYSCQVTQT